MIVASVDPTRGVPRATSRVRRARRRGPTLAVALALIAVVGCSPSPSVNRSATAARSSSANTASAAATTKTATTTTATTGAGPADPSTAATTTTTATGPTLTQLVGQKLIVAMAGTTPSADLLGRIRRGEVGGVILFGSNITTKTALVALTKSLRTAAQLGGQPRFIIAVDQEGGAIKRIPWAPPTLSPPQMGKIGLTSTARTQGAETATALRALGINVDLAPVADVPASTSSFIYKQGRAWSFSASKTAALSDAFATGLESGHVLPSMKHFPGLGFATKNTDLSVVTLTASATALAPGLLPYRTAIGHHIPLIMLSNATYTAYDRTNAAGWSRAIGFTLLRQKLGFTGATITDSLDGTAHARGVAASLLAVRASLVGTDFLLTTGTEASSRAMFSRLLRLAQSGSIPRVTLQNSYNRILALKAGL